MKRLENALAAVETPQPRMDLYTVIHKAIRAMQCDTLVALGRMDPADEADVAAGLGRVRQALELGRHHLHHENQHVYPAMESRSRGSTAQVSTEHLEHEAAFERLEALARAVERSRGSARARAALELYRAFALYMAQDFTHMHVEETDNNEVLWTHFSDGELRAIHGGLMASIAPRLLADNLRWILPSITPAERGGMLAGMRAG